MKSVAVIGIGQMGSVFAHALLRAGHAVYPVTRQTRFEEVAERLLTPQLTMVCVREEELTPILEALPTRWRQSVGLVQNELLPRDWEGAGIADPTVAVVWFEKKKDTLVTPILPTLVAGPHASMLVSALRGIDVPAEIIERDEPLLLALVTKNLYILTANIGGLATGAETVGALFRDHREDTTRIFDEILAIQARLTEADLPRDELLEAVMKAVDADPDHKARGRTAQARLDRTLAHAAAAGIDTPRLLEIT